MLLIVCGLIVVVGVPLTLYLWKIADADAKPDERRFKPRSKAPQTVVTVRDNTLDPPASPDAGSVGATDAGAVGGKDEKAADGSDRTISA